MGWGEGRSGLCGGVVNICGEVIDFTSRTLRDLTVQNQQLQHIWPGGLCLCCVVCCCRGSNQYPLRAPGVYPIPVQLVKYNRTALGGK